MINEAERMKLKAVFPYKYGNSVANRLNSKGVKPARAKFFTAKIIGQVFRGEQEDLDVELELFEYRDEIIEKKKKLNELRKKNYEPAQDNPATKIQ